MHRRQLVDGRRVAGPLSTANHLPLDLPHSAAEGRVITLNSRNMHAIDIDYAP